MHPQSKRSSSWQLGHHAPTIPVRATSDRIGPASVAVIRAVAYRMMPFGHYSPAERELATAVLLGAVTRRAVTIRLRSGRLGRREVGPTTPMLEVIECGRVVARLPWRAVQDELDHSELSPTDLLPPGWIPESSTP
ncbi:MAG: hypothetical protein U0Q03_15840 [Acidimicrobiales bacterium]